MDTIRKIIHVDMDAFYASVEIRDNPRLRGKAVIVGGMPGTRGVVCTCSYEARKYGVRSGMGVNKAAELCPKGIFIHPRRESYAEVSRKIRKIFHEYTDLVEPLSLDEAYLDVTTNKKNVPYATWIAKEIRERIRRETRGLTASAGVSFNKFFAKVASDVNKPDGLTVIRPQEASAFLATLPIGKFYGVGKVTEKIFLGMGIRNGADLLKLSRFELVDRFGKNGDFYYDIARGYDGREVCAKYERKSLGTEETFEHDLDDLVQMYEIICRQAEEVSADLKKRGLKGRTVTLKIKFFDFKTITRSRSIEAHTDDAHVIADVCRQMLVESDAGKVKVRLIGVTISHFPEKEHFDLNGGLIQPLFDF